MIEGLLFAVSALLFCSFLLIVLRGAPFVPTHRRDVAAVFSLLGNEASGVFVDLGSGDGRLLAAAAARGLSAVGFELNPFLVGYSRWRLKSLTPRPRVLLADFWTTKLPAETGVVFVFLAGPFMAKLERKMQREADRLGRDIVLISYGMVIPGREVIRKNRGFVIYRFIPA